jgi:hypothetical protein
MACADDGGLEFLEPPVLPFTRGVIAGEPRHGGKWVERNPLNVPGMFYGAMTDTCGTGPIEAPANIALDIAGQEFVFRQPRHINELADCFSACRAECFDGYGTDGNERWTAELVRAWWANRVAIRDAWYAARIEGVRVMFEVELPRYLRGYLYFLEEREPPAASDRLPELDTP